MVLPGSELELDMKVYNKWREAMEAGLLNPVFAEPLTPRPYAGIDRARAGDDKTAIWNNYEDRYTPMPPASASPPAAPSFNTDHAWDMIVLAARASRCE